MGDDLYSYHWYEAAKESHLIRSGVKSISGIWIFVLHNFPNWKLRPCAVFFEAASWRPPTRSRGPFFFFWTGAWFCWTPMAHNQWPITNGPWCLSHFITFSSSRLWDAELGLQRAADEVWGLGRCVGSESFRLAGHFGAWKSTWNQFAAQNRCQEW